MAGAIIGPLVGGAVSGIFGGGGGGGGSAPSAPAGYYAPLPSQSGPANLIQTLMAGGGLLGIGPMSNASLQQSAMLADPFAGQRAGYMPAMQGTVSNLENLSSGAPGQIDANFQALKPALVGGQTVGAGYGYGGAGLAGYAGQASVSPNVYANAGGAIFDPTIGAMAGTATMNPMLQALSGSDPSMQFRYQQGLDAVERGAAATGMLGSGGMATELEQYGQGFASTEFQNMFQRQMGLQQLMQGLQAQNFGQRVTSDQLQQSIQGQNFGQLMGANELGISTQNQNFNQMFGLQGLYDTEFNQQAQRVLAGTQTAMGMQQQQYGEVAGLGSLLGPLTGATTGSPAMAAKVSAGAYGQSQDTLANFLRGLSGLMPGGFGGGGVPSIGGPTWASPGGYLDPSQVFGSGSGVVNGYMGGPADTSGGITGGGIDWANMPSYSGGAGDTSAGMFSTGGGFGGGLSGYSNGY